MRFRSAMHCSIAASSITVSFGRSIVERTSGHKVGSPTALRNLRLHSACLRSRHEDRVGFARSVEVATLASCVLCWLPSGSPPVTAPATDRLASIGHDIAHVCVSGLVAHVCRCTGHALLAFVCRPLPPMHKCHGEVCLWCHTLVGGFRFTYSCVALCRCLFPLPPTSAWKGGVASAVPAGEQA